MNRSNNKLNEQTEVYNEYGLQGITLGELHDDVKQKILENQEKANYLDYIIQDKILSKDLVHFMNFATDSEMFDKLFKDEEFTTHWYAMLRRLEKLQ